MFYNIIRTDVLNRAGKIINCTICSINGWQGGTENKIYASQIILGRGIRLMPLKGQRKKFRWKFINQLYFSEEPYPVAKKKYCEKSNKLDKAMEELYNVLTRQPTGRCYLPDPAKTEQQLHK